MKTILKQYLFLFFVFPVFCFGKLIEIKGVVFDSKNKKDVISYCLVSVKDADNNVYTDFDGNFEIKIEDNKNAILVFDYMGYKKKEVPIDVFIDNRPFYQIALDTDSDVLDNVEVIHKIKKDTKVASLLEQKNATKMVQSMSQEEMSVKGVSNVEEGMAKVSGISRVKGEGIFVRGLGDRYNNAMLNDLPVVSNNPDNKVIDLTLIPSGMIKNMKIYKTFNTNIYGDFGGATVDIETKNEYPEEMFFEINLGSGYNSISTFGDFYMVNKGGLDIIGFGSQNRYLPSEIDPKNPIQEIEINNGKSIFKDDFYVMEQSTAFPPISLSFFGGNKYKLNDDTSFGFMIYGNFDNSYTYTQGTSSFYSVNQNLWDYSEEKWSNNRSSLFVLNSGISRKNVYDLNLNIININSANNSVNFLKGYKEGYDNQIAYFRSTYLQTNILIGQILGKRYFGSDKSIDFGLSFSKTIRQEPDRISSAMSYDINADRDTIDFYSRLNYQTSSPNTNRFWTDMIDYEFSQKLSYQFNFFDSNTLEIGINSKQKFRESDINGYSLDKYTKSQINIDGGIQLINPEEVLSNYDGEWELFSSADYRGYKVDMFTVAGYLNYKKEFEKLLIELGLRFEYSEQNLFYRTAQDSYLSDFRKYTYDPFNLLPEFNLKYKINEESNLRMSLSNTITRPSMLELRPSRYINTDETEIIGNPTLRSSKNYNVDIKWENFYNRGLFSLAIFGKYIDDPIEQILTEGGVSSTYINTDQAVILGSELDIDQSFGGLINNENFKNFYIGANFTYLYTKISLGKDSISNFMTNETRPLQGASPFILNINLSYRYDFSPDYKSDISFVFNTFGDRLISASLSGIGDVYENGYPTLDFIWKNSLGNYFEIDFKAKNLLNPEISTYQRDFSEESNFSNVSNGSYKLGQYFSISLKYKI